MTFRSQVVLFLLHLTSFHVYSQTKIFDDFSYTMSKKEAFYLLKRNKKKFNSLTLGQANIFVLRRGSLVFKEDSLVHITMWSKSNLDLEKTEKQLKASKFHLESEGFEIVYAQNHWENPLIKDKNKPYMRMIHKEKRVLIEIEPRGQGGVYNVFLSLYNLDWFQEKIKEL